MQVVIDIPEEIYERCRKYILHYGEAVVLEGAVAKGTPLPKGHGRLIDADAYFKKFDTNINGIINGEYVFAPTIIKADKAESEDKK